MVRAGDVPDYSDRTLPDVLIIAGGAGGSSVTPGLIDSSNIQRIPGENGSREMTSRSWVRGAETTGGTSFDPEEPLVGEDGRYVQKSIGGGGGGGTRVGSRGGERFTLLREAVWSARRRESPRLVRRARFPLSPAHASSSQPKL